MRTRMITPLATTIALIMAALISAPSLLSQGAEGTPAMGESAETPHPAHIHSGTCAELGDVVYPLNDVIALGLDVAPNTTPELLDATPEQETGVEGTPIADEAAGEGEMVAESTTIVDASLEDIMGDEHAINVHESAENIQNYIACGDVTGEQTDETLIIELEELNDSGYTGDAALTDNGDGTTTVTITLVQTDLTATPDATPMG